MWQKVCSKDVAQALLPAGSRLISTRRAEMSLGAADTSVCATAMILLLAGTAFGADVKPSLADLPDPLVGTWSSYELSHGNTYPGVFTPFSMIGWTDRKSTRLNSSHL